MLNDIKLFSEYNDVLPNFEKSLIKNLPPLSKGLYNMAIKLCFQKHEFYWFAIGDKKVIVGSVIGRSYKKLEPAFLLLQPTWTKSNRMKNDKMDF